MTSVGGVSELADNWARDRSPVATAGIVG